MGRKKLNNKEKMKKRKKGEKKEKQFVRAFQRERAPDRAKHDFPHSGLHGYRRLDGVDNLLLHCHQLHDSGVTAHVGSVSRMNWAR